MKLLLLMILSPITELVAQRALGQELPPPDSSVRVSVCVQWPLPPTLCHQRCRNQMTPEHQWGAALSSSTFISYANSSSATRLVSANIASRQFMYVCFNCANTRVLYRCCSNPAPSRVCVCARARVCVCCNLISWSKSICTTIIVFWYCHHNHSPYRCHHPAPHHQTRTHIFCFQLCWHMGVF